MSRGYCNPLRNQTPRHGREMARAGAVTGAARRALGGQTRRGCGAIGQESSAEDTKHVASRVASPPSWQRDDTVAAQEQTIKHRPAHTHETLAAPLLPNRKLVRRRRKGPAPHS